MSKNIKVLLIKEHLDNKELSWWDVFKIKNFGSYEYVFEHDVDFVYKYYGYVYKGSFYITLCDSTPDHGI